jgi:N-carbamoyl-L-amino-acid hydrolase
VADRERIAGRLEVLWEIARGPGGGADRPAYSAAEAQAMQTVAGWARDQGLEPGIDEHGNLWALPSDWSGPLITSGSHVDTVPDGGRFDGALGTVLGLELVADLGANLAGGARAALLVDRADLADLTDADGVSAAEAQTGYLDALSDLPRVMAPLDRLRAHAEIHVATRRGLDRLGVVRHVASPRRFAITVTGESGHAGEIAMEQRHDALAAAAAIVLALESAARGQPPETVATVGTLTVAPGAVSVIPGIARLGVDMRGIDSASLQRLEEDLRTRVAEIAAARGVTAEVQLTRAGEPTELDGSLVAAALAAADRQGIPARETWSGAGHDAQHLSALTAALLVFVPLHGGESHTPQEGADLDEIIEASRVVAEVMRSLAA